LLPATDDRSRTEVLFTKCLSPGWSYAYRPTRAAVATVAATPSNTIVANEAVPRRDDRFICAPDGSEKHSRDECGLRKRGRKQGQTTATSDR
jgi:hypothetical protein